ncbi:hypothetical protein ACFQZ2_06130 [Streptomonospora algeriensis]|uniref:Uncharacterized protein n=1 Tax=Streptomonospora algeriensis TaxID=995084 RepID=A0ABW3BAZ2_9ACTN
MTETADPTPRNERRVARPVLLAVLAAAWAVLYGCVQTYWRLTGPSEMSPVGEDLIAFAGWPVVGLCAAAAVLALAVLRAGSGPLVRNGLLLAVAGVSGALLVAAAPLVLDVVGGLLPGLGIGVYPLGMLSRVGCVAVAVLLAAAADRYRRLSSPWCTACGRSAAVARMREVTPYWAYAAAYLAVAGWLARVLAQIRVGMDNTPFAAGVSMLLFEVGFVLAGLLLPLALVHSWGRVWPWWVPGLSGRRVPRWLVLGPAIGISGGLLAYFGSGLVDMVYERLHGRAAFGQDGGLDLPAAFFWISVPAYVLWGLGMAVAAYSYFHRTRMVCTACGN